MNKYLESIQSLEDIGTSVYGQAPPNSTPVLEVSGETPTTTYVEPPSFTEEINQDSVSYSAPQKVIVRTFRLRK